MKHTSVAIDGPSGAGKSTLARAVAATFGWMYVDTGAIYRTVGLYSLNSGLDPREETAVAAALPGIQIALTYEADGLQHMALNGQDVTQAIRRPEISMAASAVAAHPSVRSFLLETQRRLARQNSVVMDGRDIGTVVLPDADVKIFLTASAEQRAWRRTLDLDRQGTPQLYETVLLETRQRDYDDMHRAIAPLRQAEDALVLDTTNLTLQESQTALETLIRERLGL